MRHVRHERVGIYVLPVGGDSENRPSIIRLVHDQLHAIAAHAAQNGCKIVRTYSDPAKSGLDIKSRPGSWTLIDDVLNR